MRMIDDDGGESLGSRIRAAVIASAKVCHDEGITDPAQMREREVAALQELQAQIDAESLKPTMLA